MSVHWLSYSILCKITAKHLWNTRTLRNIRNWYLITSSAESFWIDKRSCLYNQGFIKKQTRFIYFSHINRSCVQMNDHSFKCSKPKKSCKKIKFDLNFQGIFLHGNLFPSWFASLRLFYCFVKLLSAELVKLQALNCKLFHWNL